MQPPLPSQGQLQLLFPSLLNREGLALCREAWRFCSCDACNARRLYYRLFGIPPFSPLATAPASRPAHSKKTAALSPMKNVVCSPPSMLKETRSEGAY